MSARIVISGATGRMGRTLIEAVCAADDATLAGALEQAGHATIGRDAGELAGTPCGVKVSADCAAAVAGADALIDFTRPDATMAYVDACVAAGVRMVIGTTGFSTAQKARIVEAARRVPIMLAPNMSVGVNVALKLIDMAARTLGDAYDVEVIEAHHRYKVDAPSGTALRMGEVAARALGRDLAKCAVYGREGVTGERDAKTIGFATVRGGDLVGDHTVMFAGIGERIEITHRAASRMTYAQGALRAVRFLMGRPAGLYDMHDVLGLK